MTINGDSFYILEQNFLSGEESDITSSRKTVKHLFLPFLTFLFCYDKTKASLSEFYIEWNWKIKI